MRVACPWAATLTQAKGKAPSFVVWAMKDPVDGNLDRIQIVKGWTKDGQIFEKIYDVAWSGDRKLDPSPASCRRSATRSISARPPTPTTSVPWS